MSARHPVQDAECQTGTCCPALKTGTNPALMVRMCGCERTAGRARSWYSTCRLSAHSAVTPATAARVKESSAMDLLAVNAATKDWTAKFVDGAGYRG